MTLKLITNVTAVSIVSMATTITTIHNIINFHVVTMVNTVVALVSFPPHNFTHLIHNYYEQQRLKSYISGVVFSGVMYK